MALWYNSSENRRHIFYSVFIYLVAILISTMGWLITSNTHHKEVYYVDKVTVNVNLLFMNILNHYSFKHQIVTCCHFDSAFHNTYLFITSNYQYVRSFYIQLGGETSCPIKSDTISSYFDIVYYLQLCIHRVWNIHFYSVCASSMT